MYVTSPVKEELIWKIYRKKLRVKYSYFSAKLKARVHN